MVPANVDQKVEYFALRLLFCLHSTTNQIKTLIKQSSVTRLENTSHLKATTILDGATRLHKYKKITRKF